jgi:hypothetical protein
MMERIYVKEKITTVYSMKKETRRLRSLFLNEIMPPDRFYQVKVKMDWL